MKKIQSNQPTFTWEGVKAWVYSSDQDLPSASAVYFEVTNNHGKVKSTSSDRIYYIIEGHGTFDIDSQKTQVKPTDVIIVPKNTPYDYRANEGSTLKLVLTHIPAYDPSAEVILESKEGR